MTLITTRMDSSLILQPDWLTPQMVSSHSALKFQKILENKSVDYEADPLSTFSVHGIIFLHT